LITPIGRRRSVRARLWAFNGQIVNTSNVAAESGVARQTVQRYFGVLVDTLIGNCLPAWQPRVKVRETQHPKFYLFDSGVTRATAHRLRAPIDDVERGTLLETWMYDFLRALPTLLA
jgi:predicted AAA+ superfamily ATPase